MTAAALVLNRRGGTVESERVQHLVESLDRYGNPVIDTGASLSIVVYPSPARPGEPAVLHRDNHVFMFCGRIDNRTELARSMLSSRTESPTSDIDIAATLYQSGGAEALGRICNGFIFAAYHKADSTLHIVRDPLGDQPLFYWIGSDRFIAASEPAAVLKASGISAVPDPVRVVAWMENRWPAIDNSFFAGIRELAAGHALEVGPHHHACRQYWQYDGNQDFYSTSPEDVHELFRDTLGMVVRDQSEDQGQVALSLSGGLDSASVAACAPERIEAFSWRFANDPVNDESDPAAQIASKLGIDIRFVDSDALQCQYSGNMIADGITLNSPHANTVCRLKETLYTAASQRGHRVMLAGDAADELYLGRHYWLRDLLRAGRYRTALTMMPETFRAIGRGIPEGWLWLRLVCGPRIGLRRYLPNRPPDWLTDYALSHRPAERISPLVSPALRHEMPYDYAIGHYRSAYMTYELGLIASLGIERRCPYRDRRIVELVLNLPAWYYSQPPHYKLLVRDSFRDQLPASVIGGTKGGSLAFLTVRSLIESRANLLNYLNRRTGWQEYVEPQPLLSALEKLTKPTYEAGLPDGVIWKTICLQNWLDLVENNAYAAGA